jgi:hypothetical protein
MIPESTAEDSTMPAAVLAMWMVEFEQPALRS